MRSLCASDGWGYCILWLKKVIVLIFIGIIDVDNLIRYFLLRIIYWYLDYKLNFCEDIEFIFFYYI